MKKKVGTFKIWLLAIAAVVAFSVLPKVSSLATEDQALVVKENMQEAADAAGDESSAENKLGAAGENKQETAGEGANLEAQGLEIPVSKVMVSETIKHRLAYTVSYNHDTRQPNWVAWVLTGEHALVSCRAVSLLMMRRYRHPWVLWRIITTVVWIGDTCVRLVTINGVSRRWMNVS